MSKFQNNESGQVKLLVGIIAFIGGIFAALIGAGVLFPPNNWGPELKKSATASVTTIIPSTVYDRDVQVIGTFSGMATSEDSRMSISIQANGNVCNNTDPIYKNPYTSYELFGEDFCLISLSAGEELQLIVGSGPQQRVDSILATMIVRMRKSRRGIL